MVIFGIGPFSAAGGVAAVGTEANAGQDYFFVA